jgi:hypothetical protein
MGKLLEKEDYTMNYKQWFANRGYKLEYHAIHPVWRNRKVYAISAPLNSGGAWGVFENKQALNNYIMERIKYENLFS